jgi:membrane protease subunit HflC
MTIRLIPIAIAAGVVVLLTVLSSVFIVDERQQALVLQFGQVVREIRGERPASPADEGEITTTAEEREEIELSTTGPGLYFKVPLIQDVVYYDDRILPLDTAALEVTPIDDRRLVVDAFARWRIEDPVQFRQAVQTEFAALPRLERILNAALREVLGSVPSDAVLSEERAALMSRITEVARENSRNLGIAVVDVRIKRADLPEENLQATYRRMNAERQREAADERARGQERAQEIRARAERESVELVSDAERRAQVIRGKADGERNAIYAAAFGKDPEFFAFYRSLEAYEKSLKGESSTMVISPNSEFFEYLRDDRGPATGPSARLTGPEGGPPEDVLPLEEDPTAPTPGESTEPAGEPATE